MSKVILGLDLGITSIGWALVNVEESQTHNNKMVPSRKVWVNHHRTCKL